MKFSFSIIALAALQVVSALPGAEPHLWKRISPTESANIGYATLNGGTTGGGSGPTVTVTTLAALKSAAASTSYGIVQISGTIAGNDVVKVSGNKTIYGVNKGTLVGIGLRVLSVNNVIIRNISIQKVLAEVGDAIGIQEANNVWIDHVTLSSDRDHDKDYYDGLLDITHGCQWVTVSWSILKSHWKASLVGHSDSNGAEDTKITVTYALNYWTDLGSRLPSFRFGCGHIYNNYYLNCDDGINSRDNALLKIENNVFSGVTDPIYSTNGGYALVSGNDLGGGTITAPSAPWNCPTYPYTLLATSAVVSNVLAGAGAK